MGHSKASLWWHLSRASWPGAQNLKGLRRIRANASQRQDLELFVRNRGSGPMHNAPAARRKG